METHWLKTVLFALGDWVEGKLNTRSGKVTLIIMSSLIVGASVVLAYNKQTETIELKATNTVISKQLKEENKKSDSIQNIHNLYIADETRRCKQETLEGAMLHEELKNIYNNRIVESKESLKEKKGIVEERKEALKVQELQIKQLNKISNE